MAKSSTGNKNGIRIVVAGDKATGKSSLIITAVSDNFPTNVPPVMPPSRLPDDMYPDRVPITIIDTSSRWILFYFHSLTFGFIGCTKTFVGFFLEFIQFLIFYRFFVICCAGFVEFVLFYLRFCYPSYCIILWLMGAIYCDFSDLFIFLFSALSVDVCTLPVSPLICCCLNVVFIWNCNLMCIYFIWSLWVVVFLCCID